MWSCARACPRMSPRRCSRSSAWPTTVVRRARTSGRSPNRIASTSKSFSGPSLELNLPQHVKDLAAQRFALCFQLVQQRTVDFAFAGTGGDKVPKVAHFGLPDPVDAAEPLLQPVGVPWQIVVHHKNGRVAG